MTPPKSLKREKAKSAKPSISRCPSCGSKDLKLKETTILMHKTNMKPPVKITIGTADKSDWLDEHESIFVHIRKYWIQVPLWVAWILSGLVLWTIGLVGLLNHCFSVYQVVPPMPVYSVPAPWVNFLAGMGMFVLFFRWLWRNCD